tara:strand:+ start:152 stop:286 length:135 start_codon:yes stop_codon:yes gene_type:complete
LQGVYVGPFDNKETVDGCQKLLTVTRVFRYVERCGGNTWLAAGK